MKVSLKLKLAALWASMFLYIYVDYFHLYMPSKIIEFDITQGFLLAAFASMIIPALMIFLSVALPANVNRYANISIAAVYIPFTMFNLAGEFWGHMVLGAFAEVVLHCIIFYHAWKWPHIKT